MQNMKKSRKILDELIGYFTTHQINELDIHFKNTQGQLNITISGKTPAKPKDMDTLEQLLNTTRHPEYEEYFWGLLGSSSNQSEISLLGNLVDGGDVSYENGILTVSIRRKE
jgi:HSP20 family molecular chaperone IbpA